VASLDHRGTAGVWPSPLVADLLGANRLVASRLVGAKPRCAMVG
jgi:hypothetical protein